MSKKGKEKAGKSEAEKPRPARDSRKSASPAANPAEMEDRRFLLISKALADPTRMAVLRKIARGQGRCGDMRECLSVSAATLSHHMKELENAGLITLAREGRFVHAELDRKLWKKYVAELKSMAQ